MNNKASSKILSLALAAVMVFTLLPGMTVYAEEEVDSGVVTAFNALTQGVASQTVTLGTSMGALNLPDTLGAEVEGVPDSVPVDQWESAPEYDGDIEDTYIFTPVISDEYTVEAGVALPVITVTVGEGGGAAGAVTFTIAEDEYGGTALYLPEGTAITDADLLAGVSGLDENGNPVEVTIQDTDGLDRDNPQMRGTYPNPTYVITYAATHPVTEEVFTATREVYVTLGAGAIMPLASDPYNYIFDVSEGMVTIEAGTNPNALKVTYGSAQTTTGDIANTQQITILSTWGGSISANESVITVKDGVTANITLEDVHIDVYGPYGACALEITGGSAVNLTLSGANTLISSANKAGLQVQTGNTLTITGTDTDSLTATGGDYGAGIGGGYNGAGGTINISGGTVTATGKNADKDIGPGNTGTNGTIKITGGSVNPTRSSVSPQPDDGSISVYLNTLTVGNPTVGDKVEISSMDVDGVSSAYGLNDVVTDTNGIVYFWLPQNSNATASVSVTADTNLYSAAWARAVSTEIQTLELRFAPAITTTTLPGGTVGAAYSRTLTATGTMPITWSLDSGSLPGSLTLNASTGEISGTPTAAGVFSFTVKAANGILPDASKLFSVAVTTVPGGSSPSGSSSSSSSGSSTITAISGSAAVNQIKVPYSATGGVLTSNITAANLRGIVDNAYQNGDGRRIVKISYNGVSGSAGLTKLVLTFDAARLKADEDVAFIVETPFGVLIYTTGQMLQWFEGGFGSYTITLEKSSLKVNIKQDGKSVTWNKSTPMARIGVAYTPKTGENTFSLAVTDKNGRVLPTSAYEKGMVYADIFAVGTYKAEAVTSGFVEQATSAKAAQGWSNDNTDTAGRVYYNQNGNRLTGWRTIGGGKYYFGSDGILRTGWQTIDDKRYRFYGDGRMIAGQWVEIGGKWYYFYADGSLAVSTAIDGYEIGADGARK